MEREFTPGTREEREALRRALGVPVDVPLVLSVGALNCTHKRMDYVIAEVAAMKAQPHLLLLGAETAETGLVRARAAELLSDRCTIRTLPRDEVRSAYRAADAFVLASLTEGFGIAQVEALAAGLPAVAHDTPTTAYVLGPHGVRADLRAPGALAPVLDRLLDTGSDDAKARHDWAWNTFSWERLAPSYAELWHACADGRVPVFEHAR